MIFHKLVNKGAEVEILRSIIGMYLTCDVCEVLCLGLFTGANPASPLFMFSAKSAKSQV